MALTHAGFAKIIGSDYVNSRRSKIDDTFLAELARIFFHEEYRLHNPTAQALFLGVCAVESDRFQTFEEYSDGSRYEGDMDLGNTEPGDGMLFKGQGIIQTTGRKNTQAFVDWIGDPSIMADPKRISREPYLAIMSAVYYWLGYEAKDTGRTCAMVAEDSSLSMETKTRRVNCIVYRGREESTRDISHWDLRLEYTKNAAKALGVDWA